MTEAALESATEIRSSDMGRGTALRRFMMGDALFRWATFASAPRMTACTWVSKRSPELMPL